MRDFIITGFIFLTVVPFSYATPIYGPELPEKGKIHIGAQTHYVNEKELQDDYGEMQSLQHFLLLSYGITDWFSLDLKGGAGNVRITFSDGSKLKYPAYMAGGYGFRIKAYDFDENKGKVIVGFQHISVHPYSIWIGNTKHKAVLDDWQWSTLASYDFSFVHPYLGFKWATMDYIHWVSGDRNLVKTDKNKRMGCVLGFNIPISEKLWFNVEGHFIDSEAASFSFMYKF